MDAENNNNRRPRNLQGLLRFAMEATKEEDAPSRENHVHERMDPERRQFLENALKALTIDVIEQLQTAAETIGSETATEDMKVNAMDTILNYVDDIDTAIDFCKIGGLFVLLPCLCSPYSAIRKKSARLVAELAQNNPYCQQQLLAADVLPKLMDLLTESETAIDGIRAISCLVRSYEPCLNAFTEIGGLECLLGCLQQSEQEKLITRAAFLLNSLCNDFPRIKDELIKLKVIEMIIPLIQPSTEYNICLETLLSALCSLTESNEAIERCRTVEFNFASTLDEIIKVAHDKDECKEIVEYSRLLLKNIFDSEKDGENTDR
ncbi:hsp70-binding protein 1 [Sitodiplosis mosellana]|uniref:hsp70-binding protein 1 n=1 Tax=Sitodiplosis mosellana TaxID=263140 RepID=UPI002445121E|nr:hsp70-binding protein 1 [Sitodiplosis mosellana]